MYYLYKNGVYFYKKVRRQTMQIYEGRSYENGVDFYVCDAKRSFVINAVRPADGDDICVKFLPQMSKNKKALFWRIMSYITTMFFCLYSALMCYLMRNHVFDPSVTLMDFVFLFSIIIGAFVFYFGFIFLYFIHNESTLKYHAAGHMVLDYYNKFKAFPESVEDIFKGSKMNIGCIFTIVPTLILFFSMILCTFVLFTNIWSRLICIGISIFVTFKLWVEGYCNKFKQIMMEEPTYVELNIALIALNEFINYCDEQNKE